MSKEIVLRVNKGAALTYDEMDRNQSQFYFSSSLAGNGTQLRLHYTGSTSLNGTGADYSPGFDTIALPNQNINIPDAVAAGDTHEIQFNTNDAFDADSLFVFDKSKNYLGLGTATPQGRLHINSDSTYSADIILNAFENLPGDTGNVAQEAKLSIRTDNDQIGYVGKANHETKDIYITNEYQTQSSTGLDIPGSYGKVKIAIKGNTGDNLNTIGTFDLTGNFPSLGIGTGDVDLSNSARNISVVGSKGISLGTSTNFDLASFISPLPISIINVTNAVGNRALIPNLSTTSTDSLLISSPFDDEGGNVVLNINTDSFKHEAFNIISSPTRKFDNSTIIGSFGASGKVGINTGCATDIGLTVAGAISGSGNLAVEGCATVGTIDPGSSASTSALVATTAGLVQKIAAAPVPLGGIIMWSGAPNAIPAGWTLCDGTGDANGVTVPNLVNRFIVASNSTGGTATTNVTGENLTIGGSFTTTLTAGNIPKIAGCTTSTNHCVNGQGDESFIEGNTKNLLACVKGMSETFANHGSIEPNNTSGFLRKCTNIALSGTPTKTDDNQSTRLKIDARHCHNVCAGTANPSAVTIIPKFYALAFIIYVGV